MSMLKIPTSNPFRLILVATLILSTLWFVSHWPVFNYGIGDIPIHASYGADEQGPINGALHILEDRSLLALRDAHNTQYGPLMSVMAVPAAVIDFVTTGLETGSFSAESYKNHVIWDWTGILFWARLLAFGVSLLALWAVYLIANRLAGDHKYKLVMALSVVLLMATNFHFFEYATYYRHWIFVITVLLFQVYFLVRLRQEEGKGVFSWVMLGLLAITTFGLSYFGIFFQIMWLPIAIQWLYQKRIDLLKKLLIYTVAVTVGWALIVAWVPGPFYRAIGIGFGDISGSGVSEHINEDYGNELSFIYYAEVVGANNIALILAFVLLLYILRSEIKKRDWIVLLSVALATVAYFVFFSIQSHHEPRYILPSIILLVLLTSMSLVWSLSSGSLKKSGILGITVLGLLLFQVTYHSVQIARLNHLLLAGPAEQKIVKQLLPIIDNNPGLKVLVLQDNLLGHVHDKDSYRAYAQRYGFSELGLFKGLENATYPQNKPLLRAEYFSYFHLPYTEAPRPGDYDLVVDHFRPNEPDVPNNRDACGVNIMRYWYPEICRDKYWIMPTSDEGKRAYESII